MIKAVEESKVNSAYCYDNYYKHWRRYVTLAKTTGKQEHVDLRNAYRELKYGHKLVDITLIIKKGGLLPSGMPKIAVAALHANRVKCIHREGGSVLYEPLRSPYKTPEIGYGSLLPYGNVQRNWYRSGEAPMPYIPEKAFEIANKHHKNYKAHQWFVLWEVPAWENVTPVDPYLLRRITHTLFVVEYQWDVTPIEAAIMQGNLHRL